MRLSSIVAIFSFAAIVAVFAGCSNSPQGAQTLPNGPEIARATGGGQLRYNSVRRSSVTERLIHSFGGSRDGFNPAGALLDVNGTFYGTTAEGGVGGGATVFKTQPSGKGTILHSFKTFAAFATGLINVNGTLYGTTYGGGANGTGTVFSITQNGKFTTVYAFGPDEGSDGIGPSVSGALTNVNGTLYGTTTYGGTHGDGTVFSVTTTGHETVLYSFAGGSDGNGPNAGLIRVKGTFYGTTQFGGPYDNGTVFSVTTAGKEKVLHRFSGQPDGKWPLAGLTNVNGTLYGTTEYGGSRCYHTGCGTVFSIDVSGNEVVLHSFADDPDGSVPSANLLNVNGTLYGTTQAGGTFSGGTVFSVTTSGQEAVLHSFKDEYRVKSHGDGLNPVAGLINVNGTLYGTTALGGNYARCYFGCGTIFKLTP